MMKRIIGKLAHYGGKAAWAISMSAMLAAAPTAFNQTKPAEYYPVPESYRLEGIPAIKKADVDHLFYDPATIRSNLIWSADVKNRRLLVTDETNNIYLIETPLGPPEKLTNRTVPEAVKMAPHGQSFAYISDHEKPDAHNLYVYGFKEKQSKKLFELSGKDESIESFTWSDSGDALFYMRVDYDVKKSKLCRHDITSELCYQGEFNGIWDVVEASGKNILLKHVKASSSQHLFSYDVESNKLQLIDDEGNCRKATFGEGGRSVIWTSEGNRTCKTESCLLSRKTNGNQIFQLGLPSDLPYPVDIKISPGGKYLMVQETKDGVDRLRVFPLKNGRLGKEYGGFIPTASVVWNTRWLSETEVAYTYENFGKPASIQSFDFKSKRHTEWTKERLPEQLRDKISSPQVIKWTSFDGTEISGYVVRPKTNQTRLPVMIYVHGGPQILDKPIFNSQDIRLSANLGLAIIHTNIRGSSGFGKAFMNADDRERRGDAIQDIRALIDWIEKQPGLDANRIYLRGASYGGFVVLSTALQEPSRVKGVIAEYPLVSIRGYLSQSWIDEFAITEYGDPKNQGLMARLDDLSPLGNAGRWNSIPLLLTRGKSDSRVPEKDVTDLKQQLQGKGAEVWYIFSTQDGHGFSSKYTTAAMYQFLKKRIEKEK